ncbi:MAG TPA: transcriptional regulator [Chloroflexi bacterium]|nr:transcriptional regulator [Chloroflexota bacterium]
MAELDTLIHQPTRLRIMAALVSLDVGERVDFVFLRDLLDLTDGNLSAHLQKLEEAGYVSIDKVFEDRRPKTWIWVTARGRQAFEDHVNALEEIVQSQLMEEI